MGPKKKPQKKNAFDDEDAEKEREAAAARARALRLEEERLRLQQEAEFKEMLILRKRVIKREIIEEKIRERILQCTCLLFDKFKSSQIKRFSNERKHKEWLNYMNCIQPFPYDPPNLNSFLDYFHRNESNGCLSKVNMSCKLLTTVIERVDNYINRPYFVEQSTLQNLIEVKGSLCKEIVYKYDTATFQAIMDVQNCFDKLQFWKTELFREEGEFYFWLWGWAVGEDLERRKKDLFKDKMPFRKTSNFTVRIPRNLKYKRVFLRLIHVPYDLFSWKSDNYNKPKSSDMRNIFDELLLIKEQEIEEIKQHSEMFDKKFIPWWYLKAYPPEQIIKTESSNVENTTFELPEVNESDIEIKINECESGLAISYLAVEENSNSTECSKRCITELAFSHKMLRKKGELRSNDDSAFLRSDRPTGCFENGVMLTNSLAKQDSIELKGKQVRFGKLPGEWSSDSEESSIMENEKTIFNERKATHRSNDLLEEDLGEEFRAPEEVLDFRPSPEGEGEVLTADDRIFLGWNVNRISDGEVEEKYIDFVFNKKMSGKEVNVFDNDLEMFKLRSLGELLCLVETKKSIDEPDLPGSTLRGADKLTHDNKKNKQQLPEVSAYSTRKSELGSSTKTKKSGASKTEVLDFSNITIPNTLKAFDEFINKILAGVKDSRYKNYTDELLIEQNDEYFNLRKYHIIGGIFLIDLIQYEPQPKPDQDGFPTQIHYGERNIKIDDFFATLSVHFDAATAAERAIKESVASFRKSIRSTLIKGAKTSTSLPISGPPPGDDLELEDDDTIHIRLKVYDRAVWHFPPFPVLWDSEKKCWTSHHLYDHEFREREGTLFFKLGKTSQPLAVACNRWSLLPFRSFLLEPVSNLESPPTIILTINTNFACKVDFQISEMAITLRQFTHEGSQTLDHLIGVAYNSIDELIASMRECNLDVFPELDTFLYTPGSFKKCKALEDHLYMCLAVASPAFFFKDSHWNIDGEEEKIVFRMKQYDSSKFIQIAATPFRTYICPSEDEININLDESVYYPDLKNLIERIVTEDSSIKIQQASGQLIANVYGMLSATKVLSYT